MSEGIPYSVGEVEAVLEADFGLHAQMDEYHRSLMRWLLDQVQRQQELLAEALPFVEEAQDDEQGAAHLYRYYPERRHKHMKRGEEIAQLADRIKAAIPHGTEPEALSAPETPDLSHPPQDTESE